MFFLEIPEEVLPRVLPVKVLNGRRRERFQDDLLAFYSPEQVDERRESSES
jgi:hypothetical protein